MRILIVVEDQPRSRLALGVGAKLAVNLWAHVNLLTAAPGRVADGPVVSAAEALLNQARRDFLELCGPDAPYSQPRMVEEIVQLKPTLLEIQPIIVAGQKDLKPRLRFGDPAAEIAAEAIEEGVDLVILGAEKTEDPDQTPLRAAMSSYCSTLIIREDFPVESILVGVENPALGQTAREMFHQMATIFQAPSAVYRLPAPRGRKKISSEVMEKLIRIFEAHDLGVVSGDLENVSGTIKELYDKAHHNLLILR
ncbi:MAG: universal stress protein [Pseudomonadota bacterium]